jgi:hypothetical protein
VSQWYRFDNVTLPNGNPEEDIRGDDVGVLSAWVPPDLDVPITNELRQWARTLVTANPLLRQDAQAKHWVGKPLGAQLGLNPENKIDRAKIKRVVAKLVEEGTLRVVERLDEKGRQQRFWQRVQLMVERANFPTTLNGLKWGGPTPQTELPHHLPHLINKGGVGGGRSKLRRHPSLEYNLGAHRCLGFSLTFMPPAGTPAFRRSSTVGIHTGLTPRRRWIIGADECRARTSGWWCLAPPHPTFL